MIKNIFLAFIFGLITTNVIAQNTLKFKVVSDEKEPIVGASIYIKNSTSFYYKKCIPFKK